MKRISATASYYHQKDVCDDQIETGSVLKQIYHHPIFKAGLCDILGESALYPMLIRYLRSTSTMPEKVKSRSGIMIIRLLPSRLGDLACNQSGHFEYAVNVRQADKGKWALMLHARL